MDANRFVSLIQDRIQRVQHEFFFVHQKNISCTCVTHSTDQADLECKNCLGTGHKIRISIINGFYYEETKTGQGMQSEKTRIVRNYFIPDNDIDISIGDYFIDRNKVFYVYRVNKFLGLESKDSHQEILTSMLVNKGDIVLSNFKGIINSSNSKLKERFKWLT